MAIDPSIILHGLQPVPRQNPMTMLVQAQEGLATLRKRRQEAADQAAIRQVLADTGGNIEQAFLIH